MAKQEGKIDMQAIMEIYKKAGTPGEPHKLLANLEEVGQPEPGDGWNLTSRRQTRPARANKSWSLMGITCSRSIAEI